MNGEMHEDTAGGVGVAETEAGEGAVFGCLDLYT